MARDRIATPVYAGSIPVGTSDCKLTKDAMSYKDKSKQREYQLRWMSERRRSWFKDKVCARCGTTKNLQMDHVNSKTKVSHRIFSWRAERRLVELAKCQVLCCGCHKKKTLQFDIRRTDHGRRWMYSYYKCRCDLCRECKRLSNKKYR